MSFTIEQVKEVRQKTGLGVVEAKSALEKHGSVDAVVDHIRDTAGSKNVFRGKDRGEGRLIIGSSGSWTVRFIEVRAETDFATRTPEFGQMLEDLMEGSIFDDQDTMGTIINPVASKLGESIWVANDKLLTYEESDMVCTYEHSDKAGAVVIFNGWVDGCMDHMKKVTMHVLGMNPTYISRDDMPKSEKEKFLEPILEELKDSGKPDNIKQKIADGKLGALFKEKCLLDQPFAIDPGMTVGQYLEKNCPGCKIVNFYSHTCLPGESSSPAFKTEGGILRG